ncbi:MAG: hypothetical protein WC052_04585 [Patescibacteria group bacterium]|jgi:hypothetical protein
MKKFITIVLCVLILSFVIPSNLAGQASQQSTNECVVYNAGQYDVCILKGGPVANPSFLLVGRLSTCDSTFNVQGGLVGNPSDSAFVQMDMYAQRMLSTDSCAVVEFFALNLDGSAVRAIIERDGLAEIIIVGETNFLRISCSAEGETILINFLTPEPNTI